MAAVELHRTRQRNHLALDIRVERLEEDADVHEDSVAALHKQLASINARLAGLLISLVVASLMLAANLALK